jgi:partner of Y14 and mago protein
MDRNAIPQGHILGWVAPSSESKPKKPSNVEGSGPMSKSAKKNANRSRKKKEALEQAIKANWDDSDDDTANTQSKSAQPDSKSGQEPIPEGSGAAKTKLDALTATMAATNLEDQ